MVKIHKTAIVDKSAKFGKNVEIAPFAVIGENVTISDGTFVGPHCVIKFAQIGKNNYFTASAYIGTEPQDFSYKGEETKIVIGDNNIIREGVSLHRATKKDVPTTIGSNCMFMANSHVGHDGKVGNGVIMVNSTALSGHVEVEDNAVISGFVGVHQFNRIGTMTMIAAGAMITMDIPPYCKAHGDRAKLVGLNLVGMVRNKISKEGIASVKAAYKTLFLSGLGMEEAINKLKSEAITPEAKKMFEFCQKSTRGIARPRMIREKQK
ncbi:MAG TPA: acyl-ACP--UDP-N-acetylglucosamine O-acyltransferase [Elusimicrobiales bacterium]|nr:acyl-ACP--UDP-N-acetylglucosamine O-acyltransferase [Elusimicrobiales bacterium]